MTATNAAQMTKLVLLIDGENLPAKFAAALLDKATELGTVVAARVYGHFGGTKMSGWGKPIDDLGLTKVDVSRTTRSKNAADFKLVIEAMDMLHTRQLDGFCIASSDGDFTALAERVRANALSLYGFGEEKAPASYQKACDAFFDCAELAGVKKAAPKKTTHRAAPSAAKRPSGQATQARPKPVSPKAASSKRRAAFKPAPPKAPIPRAEILAAIDMAKHANGWSHLGTVGKNLRQALPAFSAKEHGHATMKRLLAAMGNVETKTETGGMVYVRRKQP